MTELAVDPQEGGNFHQSKCPEHRTISFQIYLHIEMSELMLLVHLISGIGKCRSRTGRSLLASQKR